MYRVGDNRSDVVRAIWIASRIVHRSFAQSHVRKDVPLCWVCVHRDH
jgi:hypothetical protein